MANIIVAEEKKVNIFSKIYNYILIQTNLNKMSISIDKQIDKVLIQTKTKELLKELKVLRDIIYLKHQYAIMQKNTYKIFIGYNNDIIKKIYSNNKIDRLYVLDKLVKIELERIAKKTNRQKLVLEDILVSLQKEINYETKIEKYTNLCEVGTNIDKIIERGDDYYKSKDEFIDNIIDYINYIDMNFERKDLSKNERELIEYIQVNKKNKQIKHNKIEKCKYQIVCLYYTNMFTYRYFKITNVLLDEFIRVCEDKLVNDIMSLDEYIDNMKYIIDIELKARVNDMMRDQATEDEYYEYKNVMEEYLKENDENILIKYILNREIEKNKRDNIREYLKEILDDIIEIENEEENEDQLYQKEVEQVF